MDLFAQRDWPPIYTIEGRLKFKNPRVWHNKWLRKPRINSPPVIGTTTRARRDLPTNRRSLNGRLKLGDVVYKVEVLNYLATTVDGYGSGAKKITVRPWIVNEVDDCGVWSGYNPKTDGKNTFSIYYWLSPLVWSGGGWRVRRASDTTVCNVGHSETLGHDFFLTAAEARWDALRSNSVARGGLG